MDNFARAVRGRVIQPGQQEYEGARRVYNAAIDCRPAVIVQCADAADVIHCVNYARERKLAPAIRGGGHSAPGFGTCNGGIVIDLSRLRGIRVDPERRTAQVEGGCTWGDVDNATHAFGLASPGGVISTTGVGGLTTGGGFGYLSRRYGLACDNLLSAKVVTADGQLRTANASQEPDLFWAIRGGGGNFGIVTSFEFRLHPVTEAYAGPVIYPLDRAADVLRFFRDFMRTAPRELSAFFAFLMVPPGPPFPEPLWGKTVCAIMCACTGDMASAEAMTKPLREFGPPILALPHPMPYPFLQSLFDGLLPHGLHHYWKADFVHDLTEEAIAEHVKFGPQIPTINSAVHIYPMDGAIHDIGKNDTAFAYRDVRFVHIIAAATPDPAPLPAYRDWVRDYWTALHPHSAGGGYVNFLMDEGEERIASSYMGNQERLAAIKAQYDPENLFRVNQNIKPAQ
jgi:UDP-N-acetylenolpyruvoylglucosamine reductase